MPTGIPDTVCIECALPLIRSHPLQKSHPDCARERNKRKMRENSAARRAVDPEADNARKRQWYAEHREHRAAYIHNWRATPCTSCGELTHRHINLADRETFICGSCKAHARHLTVPCHYCEEPVTRSPSAFQGEKAACQRCIGFYTRAGEQLHLTRERVRQLVNSELAHGGTRYDALQRILQKRLGVHSLYEARTRLHEPGTAPPPQPASS